MSSNKYKHNNFDEGELWDDDVMWQDIEKELDKDDRKKPFIWFKFFGIFSLAVLTTLSYLYFNDQPIQKINSEQVLPQLNEPKKKTPATKEQNEIHTENAITEYQSNSSNEKELLSKTNNEIANHKEAFQIKGQSSNSAQQLISKPVNEENRFNEASATKDLKNHQSIRRTKIAKTTKNSILKNKNLNLTAINTLPSLNLNKLEQTTYEDIELNQSIDVDLKKQYPGFVLSTISLHQFKFQNNLDNTVKWMNRKDSEETPLYGISAKAIYAKPLSRSFFVGSGIGISRHVHRLNAIDSIYSTSTILMDSTYVINTAQPTYFSGERTVTHVNFKNYTTFNKLNQVSIPFLVGYRRYFNDQCIMITAGTSINLLTEIQGYSISETGHIESYSELSSGLKKGLISNINLSAHYSTPINDKIDAIVGGQLMIPINSVYTLQNSNGAGFGKSIQSYAVDLGIAYKF